jgi:hypothetical protein
MKFLGRVLFNQEVHFILSSGEPTLHPDFLNLISYLKGRGFKTAVVTNGHKPKEWWEKLHGFLDLAAISYHHNQTDLDVFIDKINCICESVPVIIYVLAPKENFELYLNIFNKIVSECKKNTYVSLKPVLLQGSEPYTKEESEKFKLVSPIIETIKPLDEGKVIREYNDGSSDVVRPMDLVTQNENNFNGWNCWVGVKCLRIFPNGDIYRASCESKINRKIGNIHRPYDFKMPTEPIICNHDECNCLPEIRIKKEI